MSNLFINNKLKINLNKMLAKKIYNKVFLLIYFNL